MRLMKPFFYVSALSIMTGSLLYAKVSDEEASRLSRELTPLGAIRSGNAAGTIPAWDGGITKAPENYSPGSHHPDPFQEDEILFTITADNVEKYKDFLSPGQLEMFRRYPSSWKMPVYPSRRSASFPDFVYEAVTDNATKAELTSDGNGVTNCRIASPFPIPQNGLEAVWNHLLRYRGQQIRRTIGQATPTSSGEFTLVTIEESILIPYNQPGTTIAETDNRLAFFMQEVSAPAFLAGQILLVHDTINQNREPRQAWVYNPGQRRVRRAPNIAFDNPGTASDGQRTTDQFDVFNGSPERYEWKLVGRRELYVPYNTYRLHSNELSYNQIIAPGHIQQDYTRYELHRVWEVEGNVKSGTSHIYAKRVFYIDEDSWQILAADQYDSRGSIWRISEAHCINYYDVPMLWDTLICHYDVQNGRYLAIGLNNQEGSIEDFNVQFTKGDFTPQRLRRRGRR